MRCVSRATFSGIVLSILLTLMAACGGVEDTAVPATNQTAIAPKEVSIFEAMLGTIPDTSDTRRSVMINDYAAVRGIFAVPLPGPEADQTVLREYFAGIRGLARLADGPFITGLNREAMDNPRREYLAFDGRNVDQSAEAGVVPELLEIAWGRFDPSATASALASCSVCPPPEIVTHNDVSFYSWGEDNRGQLTGRDGPPAFDQLGRGGRIAVTSEYVYRTVETPGMKALIDSRAGDGPSLADAEEYRLLAQAMSEMGVYAAFFSDQTHQVSLTGDDTSAFSSLTGVLDKLKGEIGKSTLLVPYQTFAVGIANAHTGPYMALALVHADPASAGENSDRLRLRLVDEENYPELQDWRDLSEGYEMVLDGRVITLRVRGDGVASAWMGLVFGVIPLIPHE